MKLVVALAKSSELFFIRTKVLAFLCTLYLERFGSMEERIEAYLFIINTHTRKDHWFRWLVMCSARFGETLDNSPLGFFSGIELELDRTVCSSDFFGNQHRRKERQTEINSKMLDKYLYHICSDANIYFIP